MSQMKVVQLHEYGGPEVLKYEDAPRPAPAEGQVLIRVQAAAVNPFDAGVRAGFLAQMMPLPFPIIPGMDLAGVIEEVGAGVIDFQPGDKVYAYIRPVGASAEFVATSVENVAHAPKSIDAITAAAVPNATLVAWHALFDLGGLDEGQSVLVHGAAGGVGHVACQLAKWKGAKVIGTASTNFLFCQDLDLDQTIDYQATAFEDEVSELDVVLDTVGKDTYTRSGQVLKSGGALVSTVRPMEGGPSEEMAAEYDIRQEMVMGRPPTRETLTKIAELIDNGDLSVSVSTVLPLAEAAKAHEMIASGHTAGKIVLEV